ncbi:MAG: hypothetical protein MZU95_09000 [Desulfomicrobium escambiense]|nr:hypothetical protein [Desulfomicrobium escambiense]
MTKIGLPVPAGFTIATEVCDLLLQERPAAIPTASRRRSTSTCSRLEKAVGKKLGDADDPLLGLGALRRRRSPCPA